MRPYFHQLLLLAVIAIAFARLGFTRSIDERRSLSGVRNLEPVVSNEIGLPSENAVDNLKYRFHHLRPRASPGRTGEPDRDPGDGRTFHGGSSGSESDSTDGPPVVKLPPYLNDEPTPDTAIDFMHSPLTNEWQPRCLPAPKADFENIFRNTLTHLDNTFQPRPDRSVFYSGIDLRIPEDREDRSFFQQSRKFAEKDFSHYDSFSTTGFDPRDETNIQTTSQLSPADLSLQQQIQSSAYARASSGEVLVFLAPQGLIKTNTWTDYEWPELVKGGQVTKISRINPDNEDDRPILWEKGDSTTMPFPINVALADISFKV